ncbi:unnamed protein product, partial [Closterium sp. NIES-53]
ALQPACSLLLQVITHATRVAASSPSNHVLPCRPPGTTVDIKKSSHKKQSKWMHAKAVDGLISGREDKHRKELIISSINHRHQSLLAFWPHKTSKPAQAPVTALEGSSGVATGTGAITATTTVEEVFKPSLHVSPLFEAIGLDPHAFYSPSAVHNAALSYISLHSLTNPSDLSLVILDATLCDALYKGAIKKGLPYPTECLKRDVGPLLLRRMQAQHKVEKGGRSVERKGEVEPVQIFVRGRQGSRNVTRVTGVEAYLVEAELLAAELREKFASSTSVAEVP